MLLEGQSINHVAAACNLPRGTVKTWSAALRSEPGQVVKGNRAERIGDLVVGNLEALLRATQGIVESVSQDKEWIKAQSASELAVFVGVLHDKAFRILEALPEPAVEADDLQGVHTEG